MSQHALLSPERWARFSLGQQILQIGVEMQRARSSFAPQDRASLHASYERSLRLVDLTVQVNAIPHLRRELLRWRGVIAGLYLRDEPDKLLHEQALRVLLELHPEASKQIPFLGV
jgi:hypothetical protein